MSLINHAKTLNTILFMHGQGAFFFEWSLFMLRKDLPMKMKKKREERRKKKKQKKLHACKTSTSVISIKNGLRLLVPSVFYSLCLFDWISSTLFFFFSKLCAFKSFINYAFDSWKSVKLSFTSQIKSQNHSNWKKKKGFFSV